MLSLSEKIIRCKIAQKSVSMIERDPTRKVIIKGKTPRHSD